MQQFTIIYMHFNQWQRFMHTIYPDQQQIVKLDLTYHNHKKENEMSNLILYLLIIFLTT